MGRPENAPLSTVGTEPRRIATERTSHRTVRFVVSSFGAFLVPTLCLQARALAQDPRLDPRATTTLPTLLRPRVESLLREGDTLGALDLLQDPAERRESGDWADSLLDALVLPEDAPPKPFRTRSAWVVRLDGGFLSTRSSSGTSSGTLTTDGVVRIPGDRVSQSFRGGVRWHALRGEVLSTTGIEPQATWSAQAGSLAGTVRGWALWTQELGNNAGFDMGFRTQVRPSWWTGAEAAFSLAANRSALFGVGVERRAGPWSLSGSLRAGWMRLVPLDPETSKSIRIDSLTGGMAWSEGQLLDLEATESLPGEPIESITPHRWILATRCQALRTFGDFQAGLGIVAEGLRSWRSERWLPDSRTTFVSGTPILSPENQPGRTFALKQKVGSGFDLVPVEAIRQGHLVAILSTPTLHGAWRPRGRAWSLEGLVAWNLPYASQPGHPLAEDREGPEARLGSEVRW